MTSRLLHLDSSILGGNSVSRSLSASIVHRLTGADAAMTVTYRDLAATPIPHLSGATFVAGMSPEAPQDPAVRQDLALGSEIVEEFLASDVVVLGVGFYNFGVPSQLKAWVDRIVVRGKTFRYGETGPVGLAGGKRVILAIARGGFYGKGAPAESLEHAETYLRGVFAFIGITSIEVVAAEGMALGPDAREASIAKAKEAIASLHP